MLGVVVFPLYENLFSRVTSSETEVVCLKWNAARKHVHANKIVATISQTFIFTIFRDSEK